MEQEIRFCTSADGTRIGYAMYGNRPGRPLIYSDGLFHDLTAYWAAAGPRAWVEIPAQHRRLVEYDRRGSGISQRGAGDLSLDVQVADIAAVVDALKAQECDLVGWFDGCAIAVSYAARYPDRVNKLVLFNPFTDASTASGGRTAYQMASLIRSDWSMARRALATTMHSSRDSQRWWSQVLKSSISQEVAARYYEEFIAEIDISTMLGDVRAPTLVLHLSEAGWIPQAAARAVATSIPDARFIPVIGSPGVYHEKFAEIVLPFLDEGAAVKPTSLQSGTAIILFADIVDSTALTERLGDSAFREKARYLDATLRNIIREAGGTPIEGKLLGDGVLSTFASARQAIEAALRCGSAGGECGLPLHLGLHAGDVISEEGNIFGGAVTIAARISDQSAPGELLVSQTVRDLARTSAGVSFEDEGERSLKGVSEAMRVWRVVAGAAAD